MPSSSGGPGPGKAPSALKTANEFTTVSYSRNKKIKNKNSAPSSPVSPTLQSIISNQPVLNVKHNLPLPSSSSTSNSQSDVTMASPSCSTNEGLTSTSFAVEEAVNINSPVNSLAPSVIVTDINTNYYETDSNGPFICMVQYADKTKNLGNLHPLQLGKLIYKRVEDVISIQSAGASRVKVVFSSASAANRFLNSPLLVELNWSAFIPSSLIYSYGVIRLDQSFSEEDFWDGVESPVCLIGFKRIPSTKDGIQSITNLVELKFKSSYLPDTISIYRVKFRVEPSIRSPIQCKQCWRFGHTMFYCRSKARCEFCSSLEHLFSECPLQASEPSIATCSNCQGPHISSDRRCPEWSRQKDIKKIMVVNKVSFKEAISIKLNNVCTSAFSFADVASRPSPVLPNRPPTKITSPSSNSIRPSSPVNEFPALDISSSFKRTRSRGPHKNKNNNFKFNIPSLSTSNVLPSPNGSFLKYTSQQNSLPQTPAGSLNWVSDFSSQLSSILMSASGVTLDPHISNIIESTLLKFLSIPPITNADDEFF